MKTIDKKFKGRQLGAAEIKESVHNIFAKVNEIDQINEIFS